MLLRFGISLVMVLLIVSAGHYLTSVDPSPAPAPALESPSEYGRKIQKIPDAAQPLLAKNGFVVVPRYYKQIFSPYIQESRLPPFVTTDSLFATYHIIFENQVKIVETDFALEARSLTGALLGGLREPRGLKSEKPDAACAMGKKNAAVERPLDEFSPESRLLCIAFLSVGAKLLDDSFEPDEQVRNVVDAETGLIVSGKGVSESPLFGYKIDYSQFIPRGFYTDSEQLRKYFRAMSWYGNCAFRIKSDRETEAAALMAELLVNNKKACAIWKKMDRIYSALLAPADDITPLRYSEIYARAGRADSAEWLSRFRSEASMEPDPTINSKYLTPDEMPRWKELTKGMRLFGKRYVPDSGIFMYLTFPEVPARRMPSGLDIMAANGSERAREILEGEGAFSLAGYQKGFEKSEELMKKVRSEKDRSCYGDFLYLAETLTSPDQDNAFPFMKTEAYKDKNLMTALACWASMRHTWQLQAKPSSMLACASSPPFGFVEPDVPYYERLRNLIDHTIRALRPVKGADIKRLEELGDLTDTIRRIAIKQQNDKELSVKEQQALFRYGETLAHLSYFNGNLFYDESSLPWMSCVTDVHTDYTGDAPEVLEVARGPAMPIYVRIPVKGKDVLAVGGVLSYYQFASRLPERLTDEQWKNRASAGSLPSLPAWTGSFVSGFDVEAVLKKLADGWRVEEIGNIDDPRILKTLEKAIRPGGAFTQGGDLAWAVEMYGKKAGRKAVPQMMGYLARGVSGQSTDGDSDDLDVSLAAAKALCLTAGPEEVPALREILRSGDESHAEMAVKILCHIGGDEAREALYEHYRAFPDENLCSIFGDCQLKSSTPLLLKTFSKKPQPYIIWNLGTMWSRKDYRSENWRSAASSLKDNLSPDREKALRREAEKLILETISSDYEKLSDAAILEVGELELNEALPLLEKKARKSKDHSYIIHALGMLKCRDSCRILADLARKADCRGKIGIISSFENLGDRECLPLLKNYLNDRSKKDPYDEMLVCDYAARALQHFYSSGPVWGDRERFREVTRREMDSYIEQWKKFLAGRPR
jgi:HEAT repeat protein